MTVALLPDEGEFRISIRRKKGECLVMSRGGRREGGMIRLPIWILAGLLLLAPGVSRGQALTEWPSLAPRVRFWQDVYTRYSTRQAVIHDEHHPEVVYGVIDLGGEPDGGLVPPPETDKEIMRHAGDRVADILRRLDGLAADSARMGAMERQVASAVKKLPASISPAAAASRVRVQRGQSDRFRLGLIRAGRYQERYRQMARQAGVPEDLAYLPHVESAFDPLARSRAGAAGIWQLMPGTGRQYLTIDSTRDERLDPWFSAMAAYAYLRQAHDLLGSWPLAITAYNHGPNGMRRAQKQFGNDLPAIIENYKARTFGFASRNFYAEFLAARRIASDPARWFGAMAVDPVMEFETFTVPQFVEPATLETYFSFSRQVQRDLNPALEPTVWQGDGLIPAGYKLRVPAGMAADLAVGWESLPGALRFHRTVRAEWYEVRRGDNLGVIARRHGTSVSALRRLNGLGGKRFIYPGQKLKTHEARQFVPVDGDSSERGPVHVVRRGETLSGIGRRYGVALAELIRVNGMGDASLLLVGEVLVLPAAH